MARSLRIQYAGACYHIMSRGDRRDFIFRDDVDRRDFLDCLDRVVVKCGWDVFAYCLLGDHFHLVVSTPQPNLVVGMKWFLGTYTLRFNRRHRLTGHVFSGRYKSLIIDGRSPGYLRQATDYVHLNPARASLLAPGQSLGDYVWSSYPAYLEPRLRPAWLRIDRILADYGIRKDDPVGRKQLRDRMEAACKDGLPEDVLKSMRRGWRLGGSEFLRELTQALGRPGASSERASERRETDQLRAEDLLNAELKERGLDIEVLRKLPKGHVTKVELARRLRAETPMTRAWVAQRLEMGSASYVSQLLGGTASSVQTALPAQPRPSTQIGV